MRADGGDGGNVKGSNHPVRRQDPTSGTICVVDDDHAVRAAMSNLLEASGHAVHVFESGEAFLASPQLNECDVAVFDIKLRGMDGFAIQQECLRRGLRLPVLFISGHGDRDMERRAIDAGALALLRKPVDPDLLCAYIEDRLGSCRSRS